MFLKFNFLELDNANFHKSQKMHRCFIFYKSELNYRVKQFHRHFMNSFFVRKCFIRLFSNYSLALKCFGKRFLAQKLLIKCWWNWLLQSNSLPLAIFFTHFRSNLKCCWTANSNQKLCILKFPCNSFSPTMLQVQVSKSFSLFWEIEYVWRVGIVIAVDW
jgi:hypothetical protein